MVALANAVGGALGGGALGFTAGVLSWGRTRPYNMAPIVLASVGAAAGAVIGLVVA